MQQSSPVCDRDQEYVDRIVVSHARRELPSNDGFIVIELSERPVKYHISQTFLSGLTDAECHKLALSSCRMACYTADVLRGKISFEQLRRAMTVPCMDRLQTLTFLLETHMMTHPEIKAKFCYLPAVPHWITGMLVSDKVLEMAVQLTIGKEAYLVNLKLEYIGSRWMCTLADLG